MTKAERREGRKVKRGKNIQPAVIEVIKREPLLARNDAQRDYIASILKNEQTFALGPAGTGKTFIPATIAADMLAAKTIKKIILCRPAVEADESHGFLPGSLEQKLAPWVLPFTEVMEERLGKSTFRRLLLDGSIEVAPFAYMRGRTFKNAFVILDEAQNTTPKQMKMFLTRLGEGVRVVLNGDITQRDIDRGSGLTTAVALAQKHRIGVGIVEFKEKDVVRSEICKAWTEAFEGINVE